MFDAARTCTADGCPRSPCRIDGASPPLKGHATHFNPSSKAGSKRISTTKLADHDGEVPHVNRRRLGQRYPRRQVAGMGHGRRHLHRGTRASAHRGTQKRGAPARWEHLSANSQRKCKRLALLLRPVLRGPPLLSVPRDTQRFDEVAAQVQGSGLSMVRRSEWADVASTNGSHF